MISLNEGHNLQAVCDNLNGWAQEVFLVDSYSKDDTIDIALANKVYVVQRRFRDFADQWNFALEHLPITAPWTMKLDPDERITKNLKQQIANAISEDDCEGMSVIHRMWFMGKPMPVRGRFFRIWRTGRGRFSEVAVNEHPSVQGKVIHLNGEIEHHDSPHLHHWLDKQNSYTTAEAIIAFQQSNLAAVPRLFGSKLQRTMWLKKYFRRLPFRYQLFFLYNFLVRGAWKAGSVGWAWASMRSFVMRMIELKRSEMVMKGRILTPRPSGAGEPDPRVRNYDSE